MWCEYLLLIIAITLLVKMLISRYNDLYNNKVYSIPARIIPKLKRLKGAEKVFKVRRKK
jgi:hypothetical protein